MDVRRTILVGPILVLTLLLAACSNDTADQATEESDVLLDSEWVLTLLNGDALIEGTEITLNFKETSLDGSAGCNTYGGSYTASEGSLSLSGVYATEMGCPEPQGILDQEQAYLNALNAAASFQVDGEQMEVYDESGALTLVFVR